MPDAPRNLSTTRRRRLFFVVALATTVLFIQPLGAGPPWDKPLHALFFGILTALAYFFSTDNRAWLTSCLHIIVLSGCIEILQAVMPNREMSALDMLANVAGVLLTAAFMLAFKPDRARPDAH